MAYEDIGHHPHVVHECSNIIGVWMTFLNITLDDSKNSVLRLTLMQEDWGSPLIHIVRVKSGLATLIKRNACTMCLLLAVT